MQIQTAPVPASDMAGIFSNMRSGSLVEYRETTRDGVHFGRFREFDMDSNSVVIETIPAYKAKPQEIVIAAALVDRATVKPRPNSYFSKVRASIEEQEQAEADAALALIATKKAAKKAAKSALVIEERPAVKVEAKSNEWRKAAAAKAWEKIRAKKAAAQAAA